MSTDGRITKWRRNIAKNCNRLNRAHERYRQTDGWATTYSERKREFMFAKSYIRYRTPRPTRALFNMRVAVTAM